MDGTSVTTGGMQPVSLAAVLKGAVLTHRPL